MDAATMRRIRRRGGKVLRPVHPNCGIERAYRRRILALVDHMGRSFDYWLKAAYRKDPPRMAQDAVPAAELQRVIEDLAARWQKRFDEGAPELAAYFATAARSRSDAVLKAILRKAGYSVRFQTTAKMRDVMRATVEQNVQLISNLPQEYLTRVQGAVMRSVQTGRDLAPLMRELREQFGITRRRAALISLDQNNKATSAMQAVRQTELGIEKGIWMHSHAGKEPRPTHLANDGKEFVIAEGWYDPDPKVRKRILPGELIRCRCTWRPVVKGFS